MFDKDIKECKKGNICLTGVSFFDGKNKIQCKFNMTHFVKLELKITYEIYKIYLSNIC